MTIRCRVLITGCLAGGAGGALVLGACTILGGVPGATLGLPPAAGAGEHTREALSAWGIENVDELIASGAAVQPE